MGNVISLRTRKYIEAQGFLGLDDIEIAQLNYWLRFAPAICATWAAVGLYYGSPAILASLAPFALLGGILNGHPFDVLYNYGFRFLTGGPAIPAYGKPRRSGCLAASVVLSTTAACFYMGFDTVGYALGSLMLILPGVNVLTGFCLPSYIYGKVFGAPLEIRTPVSEG